jgi:excisionase family DNA binding protein
MTRSNRKDLGEQWESEQPASIDGDAERNKRSIMAPGDPQRRSSQALLLSVSETATLLGIHRATVYDLLASGELRSTTLGRRRVIPRVAVEAFVAMLDQRAEQEAERQRASR